MFTGIIEEIGKIVSVQRGKKSSRLYIQGDNIFNDLKKGDSIAVNGVCLTVCSFQNKVFTADVMSETLSRSSLGALKSGINVNLERAMSINGRFGGHIVSGHIDGTGIISNLRKDDNALWVTVTTSEKIMRYIVEKGSISIDGISLTVVKVDSDSFQVSIIPHTVSSTTLTGKSIGKTVNLEVDIIGKYIERFLAVDKSKQADQDKITMNFLTKNGF
ncbi:riboflavin synthase [Clostridium sp. JNZ X4-2]